MLSRTGSLSGESPVEVLPGAGVGGGLRHIVNCFSLSIQKITAHLFIKLSLYLLFFFFKCVCLRRPRDLESSFLQLAAKSQQRRERGNRMVFLLIYVKNP